MFVEEECFKKNTWEMTGRTSFKFKDDKSDFCFARWPISQWPEAFLFVVRVTLGAACCEPQCAAVVTETHAKPVRI